MDIERTESSGTKMDTMFAKLAPPRSVLLMCVATEKLMVWIYWSHFEMFAAAALCLTGNLGQLKTTCARIGICSSVSQLGLSGTYVNFGS